MFSIVVHGGAGAWDAAAHSVALAGVRLAAEAGFAALAAGASAPGAHHATPTMPHAFRFDGGDLVARMSATTQDGCTSNHGVECAVALLGKLLGWIPGIAPVDFRPLSARDRARVLERVRRPARVVAAAELVVLLGDEAGRFRTGYERVLDEVKRRCKDAEVWQNFFLDLLDEDGEEREEGEGVGAEPVEPDEELLRLLAGITVYPQVRSRFGWELGYHTLRYALRGAAAMDRPRMVAEAARSAAEDFLLAFDAAQEPEGRVNALGDLAGACFLGGDPDLGRLLCDYAAELSAEEAIRQELHRVRREGEEFVRASYGLV